MNPQNNKIDFIEQSGLRYDDGVVEEVDDYLTVEEALQININGDPFTVTMRTPGNDDELVKEDKESKNKSTK